MNSEALFRAILLVKAVGYIVPRFYYRRQAVRANPSGESELQHVTESKLRLALMGISGLGANLLVILWIVQPAWLGWSRLLLPDWLRWAGIVPCAVALWLGYLLERRMDNWWLYTLNFGVIPEAQKVT